MPMPRRETIPKYSLSGEILPQWLYFVLLRCIFDSMFQHTKSPKTALAKETFKNEWALQLKSLERSVNFLNVQLEWSVKTLRALETTEHDSLLAFCEVEAPIVMNDAREAISFLRLVVNASGHCDIGNIWINEDAPDT